MTESFLLELFRLAFLKKSVIEILREHLKFQYIDKELIALKKIYKSIVTHYDNTGTLPTYGIVSMQHKTDLNVQEYISKIKNTEIVQLDNLLVELEGYIKYVRYQIMLQESASLYNQDKHDDAIKFTMQESEEIAKFSITKGSEYFSKVFADYEKIMQGKLAAKESGEFDKDKLPFGIRPLDEDTYGGVDRNETVLFIARSGVGKSTVLKTVGMNACRMGFDILHVQLEGTREEAIDKYTQIWTAQKYNDIKYGSLKLDEKGQQKLKKVLNHMEALQKDIYVYAPEQFDTVTMQDIRDLIIKYEKERGKLPDLLIIDSLDLLLPGDGLSYGYGTDATKARKENVAKKMKNITSEFKRGGLRIVTADQASDIPKEQWNDPNWVMTRHNISGSKNLPNSFSYCITINQTDAEKTNKVIRFHWDKLRYYAPSKKTHKVATDYEHGKAFDFKRTMELKNNIEESEEVKGKRKKVR